MGGEGEREHLARASGGTADRCSQDADAPERAAVPLPISGAYLSVGDDLEPDLVLEIRDALTAGPEADGYVAAGPTARMEPFADLVLRPVALVVRQRVEEEAQRRFRGVLHGPDYYQNDNGGCK